MLNYTITGKKSNTTKEQGQIKRIYASVHNEMIADGVKRNWMKRKGLK